MKTCAQCGAEVTGRFCSACGAATSEPVAVPAFAPTSAPTALVTTLPTQTPLPWHRNGNLALGLGMAALITTLLSLAGLPFPSVGGAGAVGVGIIGWRARHTRTSFTGWYGVACAALALMLTVVGIIGPTGATGFSNWLFAPAPLKAHFVAVDVSFDANTQCPPIDSLRTTDRVAS